ncbi:unnamed protein product [Bursaphelenchus okinawaensis]|uniref:Uncharacterized protein n=1 Tax=Bursaphelenchus okinawaensis TaxID=465554 RepID=A0A811LDV2_9BILA|nr:unnamed protein product [Bursaphelenchus okinawaensis]CAG9122048.1 unnamed protein product [Bursaphelenchus okinawaensis]
MSTPADLREFVKKQWMAKIGENVMNGKLEDAAAMGKLADDVVVFVEKLIKDNSMLFHDIVEKKNGEAMPKLIKPAENVLHGLSPSSSVNTLASNMETMSVTSKNSRSRRGRGKKGDEACETSSVTSSKIDKSDKIPFEFSFSKTDTAFFICCGGWDKSCITWKSYIYFRSGFPDDVKQGFESSKAFLTTTLKNVAIMSNIHWAKLADMDKVKKGLKDLLSTITTKAPNARVRFCGLIRKDSHSGVTMYNATLMNVCHEFPTVTYIDPDTIVCAMKWYGAGLSNEMIKAMFKEVTKTSG